MAGGIDWFRWHHGSVTDPKFQLVAKKAGSSLGDVIAVWAFVLELASSDSDRGKVGQLDYEAIDCMLDAEEGTSERIVSEMVSRQLIENNRVSSWEKRQPKRERIDDVSTDRVKAFREKQRHETPCNANETQETPREEKRREEENKEQDQKQKTRAPRFDAQAHLVSLSVDASIAADWIQSRKQLKAAPTKTAIDGIAKEAAKARIALSDALSMCCQRGWRGFKAEWVAESIGYKPPPAKTPAPENFAAKDYGIGGRL